MDASPRAYANEAERRYRLRRLDDLLEALERLNLAEAAFAEVNRQLEGKGVVVKAGTLVDATLIPAAAALKAF